MIDMDAGGRKTSWRYVRVSWPGFEEVGEIDGITSCSIEENVNTSFKADGTLEAIDMPDLGDDLVRIYADMELGGKRESLCLGTFRAAVGHETIDEGGRSADCDLYSVLSILAARRAEETYSAPAGGDLLKAAVDLCKACSLGVVATPCDKAAVSDHAWDAGTPFLDVVNDIMEIIGYGSADIDAFGGVVLAPYVDPAEKQPAGAFSDTLPDVSDSSITRSFDRFDVPNVVVVISTGADDQVIRGVAENGDPHNPYSTAARGMRVVRYEEVPDIADPDAAARKASDLLKTSMTRTETITVRHAGKRFRLGDAMQMDYRRSGVVGPYAVAKRSIAASCDMASETNVRRAVRLYEVQGG